MAQPSVFCRTSFCSFAIASAYWCRSMSASTSLILLVSALRMFAFLNALAGKRLTTAIAWSSTETTADVLETAVIVTLFASLLTKPSLTGKPEGLPCGNASHRQPGRAALPQCAWACAIVGL
jgi:hypothetical protein